MTDKLSERPFHELNQIAQYAEHIRWIIEHYALPQKADEKLRLAADVLDAESEIFDALEQQVAVVERIANDANDGRSFTGITAERYREWCKEALAQQEKT